MKKSVKVTPLILTAPVFVVGTYNELGESDAMPVSWAGICNSEPPCIAFSVRKHRQTCLNMLQNGCSTLGVPTEELITAVDYFGLVSGKTEKHKIRNAKLTEVKAQSVNAPYIDEMPLILECKLVHTYEMNSHYQFIDEIVAIQADSEYLDEKSSVCSEKIKPVVWNDTDYSYYKTGEKLGKSFHIGKEILKAND